MKGRLQNMNEVINSSFRVSLGMFFFPSSFFFVTTDPWFHVWFQRTKRAFFLWLSIGSNLEAPVGEPFLALFYWELKIKLKRFFLLITSFRVEIILCDVDLISL